MEKSGYLQTMKRELKSLEKEIISLQGEITRMKLTGAGNREISEAEKRMDAISSTYEHLASDIELAQKAEKQKGKILSFLR